MKGNLQIYWFIFISNNLLLMKNKTDGTYSVPLTDDVPVEIKDWTHIQTLPNLNGHACKTIQLSVPPKNINDFETVGLRESYYKLPLAFYIMAGKASELLFWYETTKYCGYCGAPMKQCTDISKKCTHCGKEVWPQVAPAIIVRIKKESTVTEDGNVIEPEKILLVQSRNFRRSEIYGLVAGFLETGETLEECVQREVAEEINLKVKNIKYFGSQPWPYPCGVMIGFTADYDGGTITLQEEELKNANWFSKDSLPPIPDKMSIARKLIDDWIEN